jgi:Ca2+-transporting ATPase
MMDQNTTQWHALDIAAAAATLRADPERGLAPDEARQRLATAGPNRMPEAHEISLWRLALRQFRSLVVLLLLAAAGVAVTLGEHLEATAILAALVVNAAIGFGTEWRARRSLAELRALATPEALVYRRGLERVPASDVVPGDVIVLEAGSHIPADGRLIRSAALEVSEAALTGESMPVAKNPGATVPVDAPLADRVTMVYLGTTVVAGSGRALVTATGVATGLGSIGLAVATAGERATPLERQIEWLGRRLIGVALAICGVVALVGIFHGQPLGLMLETAISLAVAAIPEGLPAVTAMALAAGVWRLARFHGLVRRLPAVETLGSTTVICADKTGTMTENRMTAVRFVIDGSPVEARFAGSMPSARRLLEVAALVNDAGVERDGDARMIGDPTETALLAAAVDAGIDPERLRRQWPRRHEQPFDPAKRLMATWHDMPGGGVALLVKGAPDAVLACCRDRQTETSTVPLDLSQRERILETNRALAGQGLRVLAVAWRPGAEDERITGLTFLGLVGLQDPVRPGVKEALAVCREAGLRTIMLTGDQRATAEAIGAELGLDPASIRSRVSPGEKLALVEQLQAAGEIVAMTGDGINDAPALARADIGIAMGRRGTDVAREAADLVLTDDDFSTIVRAIAEGRTIYANLKKVIHFLFSCNLSEIVTILIAIAAGFPSPLLPLQILWVNIVTDILPAVALIRDPAEPDVMNRRARDPREAMITWRFGRWMLIEGILLALGVLSAYVATVWLHGVGPRANTVAFLAVVLIHPLQAMNCRSELVGWWRLPRNVWTWVALAALVFAQWCAISWPPLARVLGTVPLATSDWVVSILAVLWPVVVLESLKWSPRTLATRGAGRGGREPRSAGARPRPRPARRRG